MSQTTKQVPEKTTEGGKTSSVASYDERIGSRKVRIKQVSHFSILPVDKEIRSEVVKKIGSTFRKGTQDIIRGLNTKEEQKYLPSVLGVSPSSNEWNERTKTYWADFSIEVPPSETGVEIEIGMKEEEGELVPIDLDGYMKYNFCKQNKKVAVTKEELSNKFIYTFYIEDLSEIKKEEEKAYVFRKQADREFVKIVNSSTDEAKSKIDHILRIAGGDNFKGINILSMSEIDKEIAFEKLKDTNTKLFLELVNDPNLKTKALLYRALSVNEITLEGSTYFMADMKIGASEKETIGWLDDPAQSANRSKLIERINALSK